MQHGFDRVQALGSRRIASTFVVLAAISWLWTGAAIAHTGVDRTVLTAERDAAGNVTAGVGSDVSFAAGRWTADVIAVEGKPAQAFVSIKVGEEVAGIGGKAEVGRVLRSNQVVPGGVAELKLTFWGGNGPAKVAVAVNHP